MDFNLYVSSRVSRPSTNNSKVDEAENLFRRSSFVALVSRIPMVDYWRRGLTSVQKEIISSSVSWRLSFF